MPKPAFAEGRDWTWGASRSKNIKHRVYHDHGNGYEYERDPRSARRLWHEINPRDDTYRDVDPETGTPVAGSEGEWRKLR